MARPVTGPVLRALVSQAREDDGAPDILAVCAPPRWEGESVLEAEGGPFRIAPCISPLAVRDVLAHREADNGEMLVILTDRSEEELGQEVLARVWRQRLLRPSGWEAAKQLYRVDRLDPALADQRWLIDLLVDVAPPRGYPPPPSGFLDAGTAWRTFLRHGLRLDVETPSLADLLRWGQTEAAREALSGPAGKHRDSIARRLDGQVGPAAPHILRLVREGRGADLVPLGLIADVLWGHGGADDPAVLTARVRFETPVGAQGVPAEVARTWGEAATDLVRRTADRDDEGQIVGWLTRAENLLTDLDALDLAIVSDVLPWAFTARLLHAGRALNDAIDDPTEEKIQAVRDATLLVERHLRPLHEGEEDRVRRLKMAARLLRRTASGVSAEAEGDLKAMVSDFASDGAWVDAAREAIGHGETVSTLADAYARLLEKVDAERRARDRRFAEALAGWSEITPSDSAPLLPIERVLKEIVAPVAERAPTLFLVLDGLSWPEATRLFQDLRGQGWQEKGPEGRALPHVVAALPTVTQVSRATLLSGRLTEGGQDVEREGFEGHTALREASKGSKPLLFHKKDLKTDHGRIAPDVRNAVLDPGNRIVGVVVNAVDDHLDKGSQLRLAEGLRALRPLRPLLDAALEAGRAVVLASDHGHVLENGSSVRVFSGSGERWRPATEPPGEDEVELAGPRVVRGGGRIVAPAVETIRYMSAEKRGYHGGATPQEVLCPLTVLTAGGVKLEGWDELPVRTPAWWEGPSSRSVPMRMAEAREPEPVVDPDGQANLFTPEGQAARPSPDAEGWIAELLESPILEEQREAAGRQALDDPALVLFLTVLDRMGGTAPPAALIEVTDLPLSRLRGKLEALRRMLNVDGYPVLTLEADGTARLNKDLLATQFQVQA